jgi:hypothetical protein
MKQNISLYVEVSSVYHDHGMFSWLPQGTTLWLVPGTKPQLAILGDCDLKAAKCFPELRPRRTSDRDEGECIVALTKEGSCVGFHNSDFNDTWVPVLE